MNHPTPVRNEILNERLEQREKAIKNGEQLALVVLQKGSHEFLGCYSLEDLDQKTPEMGGWLKESAQGNHYGQETALRPVSRKN